MIVYVLIGLMVMTLLSLELGKRWAKAAKGEGETDADLVPAWTLNRRIFILKA